MGMPSTRSSGGETPPLYQGYSRAGAKITREPHVQPYGIRDFHVRDPNGLVLIFGQDVD